MVTKEQERELRNLLAAGHKIAAIKLYRELTKTGLAEAMHAVERLAGANLGLPAPAVLRELDPKLRREAEAAALAAISAGNPVEAIKRYRQHTKVGLKEAKEAIDVLGVVHRTGGRVDAKLARRLLEHIAASRKQEAVDQLMSNKGYDEPEARAIINSMAGPSCRTGCLRLLVALFLIGTAIAFLASGGFGLLPNG